MLHFCMIQNKHMQHNADGMVVLELLSPYLPHLHLPPHLQLWHLFILSLLREGGEEGELHFDQINFPSMPLELELVQRTRLLRVSTESEPHA